MANIDPPGWNKALKREEWGDMNRYIVKECRKAPQELIKAWGKGGSQGTKLVTIWDGKFENLYCRIYDLSVQGKLYPETEEELLEACGRILAVRRVPHWDHVQNIAALRSILRPDQAWDDIPEDAEVDGKEDDDDEE